MDQMNSAITGAVASTSIMNLPPPARNGKIVWPEASAMKQNFCIPEKILCYMARNPSTPEVYLKLAKSCKYFFEKLPLLIVKRIVIKNDDEMKICSSVGIDECFKKNHDCCIYNVNLAKIISSKIWLTTEFDIFKQANVSNIAEMVFSKLYRCDTAQLSLYYRKLTWNEFQFLAEVFCKFDLAVLNIEYDDGNSVMLDAILKAIPGVKKFVYGFDDGTPTATPITMKNILKLQNFDNLSEFSLSFIPEHIAFEDLKDFMKKYKDAKFLLVYFDAISDGYKAQLDEFIDDVIASETRNRCIYYERIDKEKLNLMKNLYNA